MKKIAIYNQKGGVGKTTTHINVAAALGEMGKKVLMIDIDPQGNATSGIGVDKNQVEESIYSVLLGNGSIENNIVNNVYKNVDVLPSNMDLSGAEIELLNLSQKEYRLKNALEIIDSKYDYAFIDCPPSLGLLTINALVAADGILVPIQCEYFALEGVSQLLNTYKLVKDRLNPRLEINGVLMSMMDSRTNLSQQVVSEVKNYFGDKVFNTAIPRNIKLAEAPSFGEPITTYAPNSKGADAYVRLAKEIVRRTKWKKVD